MRPIANPTPRINGKRFSILSPLDAAGQGKVRAEPGPISFSSRGALATEVLPTWLCEFPALHAHADVGMAPHVNLLIGPVAWGLDDCDERSASPDQVRHRGFASSWRTWSGPLTSL